MADAHQRFAEGRNQTLPALLEQQPYLNYDVRRGQDYYGHDDGREAAFDCCPCGELMCFYNRDEISIPVDDGSAVANRQSRGVGGGRTDPLSPDASSTLFVQGVPLNCSHREVSHIFRIFVGFKNVRRLLRYTNNDPSGDPVVHCFVEFQNPYRAAIAMDCVQGYVFDEQDPNSSTLNIRFGRPTEEIRLTDNRPEV